MAMAVSRKIDIELVSNVTADWCGKSRRYWRAFCGAFTVYTAVICLFVLFFF